MEKDDEPARDEAKIAENKQQVFVFEHDGVSVVIEIRATRSAAKQEEIFESENLMKSLIETAWIDGKITSRARNVLLSLFWENKNLRLEQLRQMIRSGELKKVKGIGSKSFEKIKNAFL